MHNGSLLNSISLEESYNLYSSEEMSSEVMGETSKVNPGFFPGQGGKGIFL